MDDKTVIIIKQTADGWQVNRFKNFGLEKGETVLATLCGGNLGKALAIECAKAAATIGMADEVVLELKNDMLKYTAESFVEYGHLDRVWGLD